MAGDRRRTARRMGAAVMVWAASGMGACALLGGGEPAETPAQLAERTAREAAIVREVQARMAAEPSIDAATIRPVVVGTEVHLHGSVRGFGALQCAKANAELVSGVTLVIDFLVLQPGPSRVACQAPRVPGARQTAGP
ncbi:MAG: BON domain-containing protein [Gemmatimonadetes bacterium]|nr:BON domain-containing protein [Gemmatimonadota bacterium]